MSGSKRAWKIAFTRQADNDILEIFAFIVEREGPDAAEAILEKFITTRDSLRELPDRGRIPPELERLNIFSFREIQIRPYRVVYQMHNATHEIHIHVVADGRRNFAELLKKRLLNPTSRKNKKRTSLTNGCRC
jgi:toxin ParE1/3/4